MLFCVPLPVGSLGPHKQAYNYYQSRWSYHAQHLTSCRSLSSPARSSKFAPLMIDAVLANDEGRCCTDVVPLTPITSRAFPSASQSQTVVVNDSQSAKLGVLANQTLYLGASMPSKYSHLTPGKAFSIARANARFTGAESCVEIAFQAPPVVDFYPARNRSEEDSVSWGAAQA